MPCNESKKSKMYSKGYKKMTPKKTKKAKGMSKPKDRRK